MKLARAIVLNLLLLAVVFSFVGCATNEPENTSSRPWGYRGGYDPGLPGNLNEGR